MDHALLQDMEILFGLAVATVILFRRLMFPSIIGFLVAGILAGPHALALIKNTHQVEQMAEIGVVLLLFTIGIEFSLKELMRIKHLVLLGGGLQVGGTILVTALAGIAFSFSLPQSIFFGFLVALSSTAILMKLLMDAGEMDAPHGKMAMGILIFQDLCVVPLMLFVPFLAGAGDGLNGIMLVIAKAAGVVLVAHYTARFLVPWIFGQVVKSRSRELFLLTILFIGFGTAWITAQVGLSLALGAFIAGLAISESEYSHQALGDIMPFRDAFMSLFFISVGMLLDPAIVVKYPLLIASLVITILLIKTVITTGAAMSLGIPMRIALITGLSLAQIGEFSFVLCQSGLKAGIFTPDLYQIFLAASVATMGLTPLCLKIAAPVADRVVGFLPNALTRGKGVLARREHQMTISDHVIIVGYGLNGRNLARVLKHFKIDHAVIETNPFTVKTERKKGVPIIFGDGSGSEILTHANIDRARIIVIAISDAASSRRIAAQARRMNPRIHVIVRTRYILEMEPLYKLGVNEVIPEEFEASVEIFSRILSRYLIPEEEIHRFVEEIRADGYAMFRNLSKHATSCPHLGACLPDMDLRSVRVREESALAGKTIAGAELGKTFGVTVLAVRREGDIISIPPADLALEPEDILFIVGPPGKIMELETVLRGERS